MIKENRRLFADWQKYTDEIRDRFINLAISYNINIITGSMPYVKRRRVAL